jgi:hypothetical protein
MGIAHEGSSTRVPFPGPPASRIGAGPRGVFEQYSGLVRVGDCAMARMTPICPPCYTEPVSGEAIDVGQVGDC